MGEFSPSTGLMCEILLTQLAREILNFSEKVREFQKSLAVYRLKQPFLEQKIAIKLSLHAVVAANCSFAFLQFEVVTN